MYKRVTIQENLVIVESPAKAKTIEKFLGKDFMVKSSFGHIRDLSKKDLGINLADGFAPVSYTHLPFCRAAARVEEIDKQTIRNEKIQ